MSLLSTRRIFSGLGLGALSFVAYDVQFEYSRATRNIRSVVAAIETLYDYKVAIKSATSPEAVSAIHDRVAERWYTVCAKNGGLYVKLGQSVTTLSHILPPEFLPHFNKLLDQAPAVSLEEVEKIVKEDFGGRGTEELFANFDTEPMASASIAQVHRATLPDGTPVAVKIQKPWIRHQIHWDLACYQLLVLGLEYCFDMPMYWATKPVVAAITEEADFRVESAHSERAAKNWSQLGDAVHVPAVFWEHTSKRVMVQEFCQGIKINQLSQLEAAGFDRASIAHDMIQLFSHQVFTSGFVHGDPHPGNLLVRRGPQRGQQQLVVLDHGMYCQFTERFRLQYCDLWKALVLGDATELERICSEWGIADTELFATFQLMKPYKKNVSQKPAHLKTTTRGDMLAHVNEMNSHGYERVKQLLIDSEKTPRELAILGRHLNIIRANNSAMGSAANRIGIMAEAAASGSTSTTGSIWLFRWRLTLISLAYSFTQAQRWVLVNVFRSKAAGFEELLQRQMECQLEKKLGLKLNMQQDEVWENVAG